MQGSWLGIRERCIQSTPIRCLLFAFLLSSIAALGQTHSQPTAHNEYTNEHHDQHLTEILSYIRTGWDSLTRSTNSCSAVSDTKFSSAPVLYLPADFPQPGDLDQLQRDCA